MRLTARGVAVLVSAVSLFVAGVWLGLPLLRSLAGVGVGVVVVAVVPRLGRLRPTVSRELYPVRVQRGAPAVAALTVVNGTDRRQPEFLARDRVGDDVHEVAVRALPPGAASRQVYDLPTGRRGCVTVGPLIVERSDLLGLASTRAEVGEPAQLWVYPARHAVRLPCTGRSRHHHEGEPPPIPVPGSMDLRSLREYVVGDELRHLHWKATARTGQLMVREYVDPAQPWCVVLLDDRATAMAPEAFEEAVEVAASILWESCEQERPSRLCTTSGTVVDTAGGAAGARDLLDRLCVLEQVEAGAGLDLARLAGGRGDGWFAHVGGAVSPALAVAATRFGRAVAFDLSGAPTVESALPTVRAADAADAVRTWNAMVSR